MLNDIRCALRQLLKSPGFTLLAVITLGLGIGANTAMFSLLNEILLRPLPTPDSDNVDRIYRVTPQDPRGNVSLADFRDLQAQSADYGEVAAYAIGATTQMTDSSQGDAILSDPGHPPEVAPSIRITWNFFSVLRVQPPLGRDFRAGEDYRGNDRVLLISDRCWKTRFGGRADIIGHVIRVDGKPHEIVGVLPASFKDWRFLGWADLFRPLGYDQRIAADRRATILRVIGRRHAGISRSDAGHAMANFGARLAKDYPALNIDTTWRTTPLNSIFAGPDGSMILVMLIGLSAFVLLIACSNLANLLLARTMSRAREFAVRAAMGARRLQLLRPLIAESLLLAFAGAGAAILVWQWMSDWLAVRTKTNVDDAVALTLDWHVLTWACGAALATSLVFGLAPALYALRLNLNDTLKTGGRGSTGTRGQQRFRQALIVGQFALAMILLAGAVIFIRGLHELNHRRSGWSSERLITGAVVLPAAEYADGEKIDTFQRLVVQKLATVPGTAAVGLATFTPFFPWPDTRRYVVEGRDPPQRGREPVAAVNSVSPQYFDAVGTRLLRGRLFGERDARSAPRVYVINQSMARTLFGNDDPIGRRIAQLGEGTPTWGEIVGVVNDIESVVPDPSAVTFQVYQSTAQETQYRFEIVVRTSGVDAGSAVNAIRHAMAAAYPDLPVRDLQTADTTIYERNDQYAVLRDMLLAFAVLGLGLASLGVYGIISRTMAQRTPEFAIRLALGAAVSDIVGMVLRSGVKLAAIGSLVGVIGAFGVSRVLASVFPGMQLETIAPLLGATVVLLGIALLACWLPARRAGQVDAMVALRAE